MTTVHLWLRAEAESTSPSRGLRGTTVAEIERRSPLSPQDVALLIAQHGFRVSVEASSQRVFDSEQFAAIKGCEIVPAGSWVDAPRDAYILGIRGVPGRHCLHHRHIYFGHAFKNQDGWRAKLAPFIAGGGTLYDHEYLTDKSGKRLASFGPVAGVIGVAAGVAAWCRQAMATVGVQIPADLLLTKMPQVSLVEHLKALLHTATTFTGQSPRVVVIGPNGRVGSNAVTMAKSLGMEVEGWDRTKTAGVGPFPELLNFHILINAIKLDAKDKVGPFLTHEIIRRPGRSLSVIVDISCDTANPNNPLPIYNVNTTFTNPTVRVVEDEDGALPVDVIAIPTLPSLVPAISSEDFSKQLTPLLAQLADHQKSDVWTRANNMFVEKTKALRPPTSSSSSRKADATFIPSFAQERLWKLARLYEQQCGSALAVEGEDEQEEEKENEKDKEKVINEAVHNVGSIFWVEGEGQVLINNLEDSLTEVINRHEILRTRFVHKGDEVTLTVQDTKFINAKNFFKVTTIEDNVKFTEHMQSQYEALLAVPFVMDTAPLLSAVVVTTKDHSRTGLILVAHQLIADEWSLKQIARELADIASGVQLVDSTGLQYIDYADWQRNLFPSQVTSEKQDTESEHNEEPFTQGESSHHTTAKKLDGTAQDVEWWLQKLSGSPPMLQVPIDFPRPAIQNFSCARVAYTLPLELADQVHDLVLTFIQPKAAGYIAREDISSALSVLFLSAYKLLLFRLSGEEDVLISSGTTGRLQRETHDVVGPFANHLIVRSHVHQQLTFEELYNQTVQALLDAHNFQNVPYERILMALDKDATTDQLALKHVPLFQVGYEFTHLDQQKYETPGAVKVTELLTHVVQSPNDLVMRVVPSNTDKDIQLVFTYNKTLLAEERVAEMFGQITLLLSQIAKNKLRPIIEYSLITPKALTQLPVPSAPLNSDWLGPIHEIFSRHARATPEKLAVYYEGGNELTYGFVEERSNELAHRIIETGIKKGDVIAIYGHRSPAVVISIFAILKAGASYCMTDPKYPPSRIIDCLSVAGPRGWIQILEAGQLPELVTEHLKSLNLPCMLEVPNVFSLDKAADSKDGIFGTGKYKTTPPEGIEITGEDIAVVTFTSGSTGMPKGVQGRHLPLTHFYPWMHERFGIGSEDRFSMCSGIAHDPLQRDIFTPAFFGTSVYIPTDETIATPGKLGAWMTEVGITVACLTPAMGQLLTTLDNPNFHITSLKAVFFVGDLLIKRDVFRLKKLAPNATIINMYGSTETQRSVGYWEVPQLDSVHKLRQVMPVGVGMKDVDLLIINNAGQQAGVGEVAEIYVRSPMLARGYLGLPEETEKKFLLNPFVSDPVKPGVAADRMYRTGDLGRYSPDGCVECAGRADDQVKIRGFRIELGEINAQLSQHVCVKENVTIVKEDRVGQKRLVSYVVPTEFDDAGVPVLNADIDVTAFAKHCRDFLRKKLPHYMVPSKIVVIQSMPLTPNGKINRAILPNPYLIEEVDKEELPEGKHAHIKALSATEQELVTVWSSVLGLDTVGPKDDFFEDLGGHSLLATQAVLHMSSKFHIRLPINILFDNPTIAAIARYVEAAKQNVSGGDANSKATLPALDLLAEAKALDKSIQRNDKDLKETNVEHVFLTGSTGFLGSFLLRDLLELSNAIIHCHVRASSEELGKERLVKSMTAHGLWNDEKYSARVKAVAGDLSLPLLGLSQEQFDSLANQIDVIVHNGAYVHWLKPYKALKATNVLGTQETLRLASQGKQKRVHHVSTTSVYDTVHHATLPVILETDNLETYQGIQGGYPQSKWVADKMMLVAREERNIAVAVYRPGYITGDTQHGLWNTDDYLCRFIKGCIQLGAAPDLAKHLGVDMSPVDYVSKATISLALRNHNNVQQLNSNYHVVNPALTSYHSLWRLIISFGYDLELVPYSEWRKQLLESAASGRENALNALLGHFTESWEKELKNARCDTTNVQRGLEQTDKGDSSVQCPTVNDEILARYLSYFIACGFLPSPPKAPNNDLRIDWDAIGAGVALLSRSNRSASS